MEIKESCHRLSLRIYHRFGYVNNLQDKIDENRYAQDLANKLSDDLEAFSYEMLADLASGGAGETYHENRELTDLLMREFLSCVTDAQNELISIVNQLRELILVYRQQERKKMLVCGFAQYFRDNIGWKAPNYLDASDVPSILLHPEGIAINVCRPDLDNRDNEDALVAIISGLRKERDDLTTKELEQRKAEGASCRDSNIIDDSGQTDFVDDYVDLFLEAVVTAREPLSAMAFTEDLMDNNIGSLVFIWFA